MASGIDVRYICSQCLFSDKIREAFVQSTMEIVCVEDFLWIFVLSLLRGSCCVLFLCCGQLSYTMLQVSSSWLYKDWPRFLFRNAILWTRLAEYAARCLFQLPRRHAVYVTLSYKYVFRGVNRMCLIFAHHQCLQINTAPVGSPFLSSILAPTQQPYVNLPSARTLVTLEHRLLKRVNGGRRFSQRPGSMLGRVALTFIFPLACESLLM
jgi:hypothetical protein